MRVAGFEPRSGRDGERTGTASPAGDQARARTARRRSAIMAAQPNDTHMTLQRTTSRSARVILPIVALGLGIGAIAQNQTPMPGYGAASATAQRKIEADAMAVPSPTSAAELARALSREPHMAGTPAQ